MCSSTSSSTEPRSLPRSFHSSLQRVAPSATALALQMAAPSASSPEYWAQLLAESTLPQSTLDQLAAEPLQATSVQSFCYGIRTREGVDDRCAYVLFHVAGPQLAVNGTAGWEQNLDQAHWKFSRWAGCVHRLWDVAKQILAQESETPALDLTTGPAPGPPFGFGMQLHQMTGAQAADMVPKIRREVRLQIWLLTADEVVSGRSKSY